MRAALLAEPEPAPIVAQAVAGPAPVADANLVAEEIVRAYRRRVEFYRRGYGMPLQEAREKAEEPDCSIYLNRARHGDPSTLIGAR